MQKTEDFDRFKQLFRDAFNSNKNEPPAYTYILKGDVSGIQEFIFNIQSDGASRMLTTRSFFIQISVQLCIERILKELKLDRDKNLITDRGGSFFIGMDSRPDSDENLQKISEQVNKDLSPYGLYISIVWVEAKDTWKNTADFLKEKEEKQKFQRYYKQPEAFKPFFSSNKKEQENKGKKETQEWQKFAKILSQSKGYRIEDAHGEPPTIIEDSVVLFELRFKLLTEYDTDRSFNDPKYALMNEFPLWQEGNPYFDNMEGKYKQYEDELFRNKWKDYNRPDLKDNRIIDLDHLAVQAKVRTGSDQLGVIKLDVDSMGTLFREKFDTQTKLKDASEAMSYFWGLHLKQFWKKETFRDIDGNGHAFKDNILIVYAGGDDCFLMGGWDAIMQFACHFKKEFDDFYGGLIYEDKPISFSASLLLLQATTPVIQIGTLAEDELDHAKHFANNRKNSISLFGEVFTWKEFTQIGKLSHILSLLIKGDKRHPPESKALLQKIRLSARGYDALMKRATLNKQVNFRKVWNLTWFILRGVQEENREIVDRKIVTQYHDAALKALTTNEYASALIYPAAARITELLTRNTIKDGTAKLQEK